MLSRLLVIFGWMLASGLAGYLLGSIPVAYLLVRWKSKLDIRNEGSGNVGSLNSYVVTRSRLIGAVALAADVLKGVAAVLLVNAMATGFIYLAAAGIGAVLGHNFPVWLKFKGGRGLATSLGVLLVISWQLAAVWVICWAIAYLFVRHINMANAIATFASLIVVLAVPAEILLVGIPEGASVIHFRYFTVLLAGLILIKHIEPVQAFVRAKREGKVQQGESSDAGA